MCVCVVVVCIYILNRVVTQRRWINDFLYWSNVGAFEKVSWLGVVVVAHDDCTRLRMFRWQIDYILFVCLFYTYVLNCLQFVLNVKWNEFFSAFNTDTHTRAFDSFRLKLCNSINIKFYFITKNPMAAEIVHATHNLYAIE